MGIRAVKEIKELEDGKIFFILNQHARFKKKYYLILIKSKIFVSNKTHCP